ncbi:MAG: hypothetical protein ACK5NA_03710 [Enterococcus sp.]
MKNKKWIKIIIRLVIAVLGLLLLEFLEMRESGLLLRFMILIGVPILIVLVEQGLFKE